MATVLGSRHITVYSEATVDAADFLSCDAVWDKRFHSFPKLIVEGLVDNPVEVVG